MSKIKYSILPPDLHSIADTANFVIKNRYGLKDGIIEQAIDKSIQWAPTLNWKTKTGYIACDVSDRPFPGSMRGIFGDITASGLPVRIIIAYPRDNSLSSKDFQEDLSEAKQRGIGLLSFRDINDGEIEHSGISVPLHIPPPNFDDFKIKIRKDIQHAYDIYINSDPKHGVQELGQIIEHILINLADQAKKKCKLTKGGFKSPKIPYAQANLIDDLMNEHIINNSLLGKCRGFVDDRNSVSHKPKTLKEAINLEKKLRDSFKSGLNILEEIPECLKEKGYKLKI